MDAVKQPAFDFIDFLYDYSVFILTDLCSPLYYIFPSACFGLNLFFFF